MQYNTIYIANSLTINIEIVTIQVSYTGNRRDNYTIHAMWKNYRNIKDGNLAIRPNNRHKDVWKHYKAGSKWIFTANSIRMHDFCQISKHSFYCRT
jgi:hypothetical protein